MRELLELQTGQVAFLTGLLSGFAMTMALQILRIGVRNSVSHCVFFTSVLSSLLFLVALYVDVRLTIELAGKTEVSEAMYHRIVLIRHIGTGSATTAFALFVVSLGMLGWLTSRAAGIVTSSLTFVVGVVLVFLWLELNTLNALNTALG